ncbi:MAG TPA: transketolase, partial [Thiolinea sp.]|nr:transketolase [Thiolinea sp.]
MTTRQDLANAIRVLAMDAVQQANSGHPGAPMGMADIAEVLFNDFMSHNPQNPHWPNRDRFVMSNGHGSMLPYSVLHLTGYDLPIEELKNFRQLHSKTPGHPEYGYTPGIETTTGPLGQGVSNAVGMALAEKVLGEQFNKEGHKIVDHYTYVFLGDGCLMEGISHEVCSFAGTMKLGKLICFYDDNGISIDGDVMGWFTDNTPKRFEAYGWHVLSDVDGHDANALHAAVEVARMQRDKPTLICCKTIIGKGAPNKQGGHDVHGSPLGKDEIAAARVAMGWKYEPFVIPADIYAGWDAKAKGAAAEQAWNEKFKAYQAAYPVEAAEFERRVKGELPADWEANAQKAIDAIIAKAESPATRVASKNALDAFAPLLPEFLGGSADLTPSNNTFNKSSKHINSMHGPSQ